MSLLKKWFGGNAQASIDDTTGALLVTGPAPDYVASAGKPATIGSSKTLPSAFALTLPDNVLRIILIPRGTVYYNFGAAASASTLLVPAGGLNLPVTKTVADAIQIFAANVVCDLIVCIARA